MTMKRKLLLSLITLLMCLPGIQAQDVIFERRIERDSLIFSDDEGPNSSYFSYITFGFGIMALPADHDSIKSQLSTNINLGIINKYRVSNHYALGFSLFYNYLNYEFKPFSHNYAPIEGAKLEDEKLNMHMWGLELFNRFNFGRRGNVLGTFLDIGFYANLVGSSYHKMEWGLKNSTNNDYEEEEQYLYSPAYMNFYDYGLRMRFGWDHLALFSEFRLSDLFNNKATYAAPGRLIIGLQIAIYENYNSIE